MPLDEDTPGLVKAGEFMGFPVYIDTSMKPGSVKLVSLAWDSWAKQMRWLDSVEIRGLDVMKGWRER